MEHGRLWRLECLIPGLILVAFLGDAAGRYVPIGLLAFRAEEALQQFRSYGLPGPYEAGRQYRNDRSTGDLAVLSNRWEYRVFRPQAFTTDDLGFRNPEGRRTAPPDVLFLGTSFTVGTGNSDRETLPARVEARSGCRTYNGGGLGSDLPPTLAVLRKLGMTRGLVVVERLERHVGEPIEMQPHVSRWGRLPYHEQLRVLYMEALARIGISPVKILFQRLYKSLQNDRVLPNVYRDRVTVRPLRDGRPMLFLREIEMPRQAGAIASDTAALVALRDALRAAGYDMAVVIVPDKLTVYRPLLREAPPEGAGSQEFLAELEQSLSARGIDVVNLAPVLAGSARAALDRGEVIYWPDDTHWNPQGLDIAAASVCEGLKLRDRCERRPAIP